VILAGRAINDHMPKHVAQMMIKGLNEVGKVIKGSKVLIMGLTYKEDVPDTRESPAAGIVEELKEFGVEVYGYDPLLDRGEIEGFGVRAFEDEKMDGVIVAVAHEEFRRMGMEDVRGFMGDKPVLVDVRGMFDAREAEGKGFCYRTL
jgi:UDP-N-acetyl-D-mannosaminuronate dehydrogenase